ncbi:MAG: hypothetical protein NXI31_17305 [bacterium]|nr:hypothetical protein [bacterium]
MSETEQPANPSPSPAAAKPAAAPTPTHSSAPESVIVRPWPKVVFLYPTFIVATIFFLLSWLELEAVSSVTLGNIFMGVFFMNLLVFSFDFSRIKSITILIGVIAAVLLVLWIDSKWEVTNFLSRVLESIEISMNTGFYGFLSAGMGFLLLLVFINTRFNYYEVNAREILHHHGYLGDIRRWSTEGLEMNKEIYDIAEYILLRSGRLIFQPATSKKAIVLDNVPNVSRIEKATNDLLSHVAVRINQRPGPG